MIELVIRGLTRCPEHARAILLLEDSRGGLRLPLWLPPNEADRLARALGLARCSRVPVFELVEALLERLEARVLRAVLHASDGGVWATLHVSEDDGEAALRCHPADALAVAHRRGAPVYATDEVARHAQPIEPMFPSATVSAWLETVKPEDFEGEGKEERRRADG